MAKETKNESIENIEARRNRLAQEVAAGSLRVIPLETELTFAGKAQKYTVSVSTPTLDDESMIAARESRYTPTAFEDLAPDHQERLRARAFFETLAVAPFPAWLEKQVEPQTGKLNLSTLPSAYSIALVYLYREWLAIESRFLFPS
jgi:hypothetical protein